MRTAIGGLVAALLAFASPAMGAARPYDFNGDGRQELVAGMPDWSQQTGGPSSGAVIVVRTYRRGLRRSAQLITRATTGVPGDPSQNERLGVRVASGDFNGDGSADLVIANQAGRPDTSLLLISGSSRGLDASTATTRAEQGVDLYGAMSTADVDRDGFSDLAVVARPANRPPKIAIFRGGRGGLRRQRTTTLPPRAELVRFADLDRDRRPDLVFTTSSNFGQEDVGVCRGTPAGPRACTAIPAIVSPLDLAAGDVTGNRDREIVVGTAPVGGAGSVHVYRLAGGEVRYSFKITQNTRGVPGNSQEDDQFGTAVEVGRLRRRGKAVIVIGAPGEDGQEGRVTLVRGAKRRIARRGNRAVGVNTPGSVGRGFVSHLGDELTLLDHNGDGRLDLDIGAPSADGTSGAVVVLSSTRRGLRTRRVRTFGLDTIGFSPVDGLRFGAELGRR
jgi:hypothetical protein